MAATPRPFTILGSNRAGTWYGLNGQTIVGNANGAWAITANGTNQNVTLTTSGTGQFLLRGVNASNAPLGIYFRPNSTAYPNFSVARIAAIDQGVSFKGSLAFYTHATGTEGDAPVERARFTDTGSFLIGGLTTNGTGVLQFPAATTNAGGINFGTEIYFFRTGTNTAQISASSGLTLTGSVTTAAPTGGAGAWKLGIANSVSPTAPDRTLTVDIGGTVYYIAAKTTND